LSSISDSRVGAVEMGGISTGERKRLGLAIELVNDPLVLFADEPTSGLDSFNANLLMEVLRHAAKTRGLMCITSIHQPPANTWKCFDKILLLTRNGHLAFSGPASQVLSHLESITGVACEPQQNPAEYCLDMASAQNEELGVGFKRSTIFEKLSEDLKTEERRYLSVETVPTGRVKQGYLNQTLFLSHRAFTNISRDPTLLGLTFTFTILSAVILGGVFYQLNNEISGSQDRVGFFFFPRLFLLFAQSQLALVIFSRTSSVYS